MKKGISIWAFPPEWTLDKSFALAAEAGFDAVELAYAASGPITSATTADELRAIRKRAQAAGVEISSLASGIFWEVNFIADDESVRAAAKEHLRAMLHAAAALEVGYILVVPGFVGPFEAGKPVIADYEIAWARAVADLREVAPLAEELGVAIGIENVWNKFLSSPMEMRAFIEAVDSPAVGVYFDVANSLRTGYAEHWIKILGKHIKGVHFKDYRTNIGTLLGFVDLFEGDVDYPVVLDALRAVGWNGCCVVEVFAREQYPEAVVLRAGADIQRIFQEADGGSAA